jgi:hypothetical protein
MSAHQSFPGSSATRLVMRSFLVAGTICTIALPAGAAEPCAMSYAAFEFAVPHVDLEACPPAMAAEGVFCRASMAGDALHVFAFEQDGEQCIAEIRSFDEDAFAISFR